MAKDMNQNKENTTNINCEIVVYTNYLAIC